MAQTVLSSPEKTEQTEQYDYDGLSQSEVQQRLERGESNDFQARVGRSYWDIFVENVLNLFNIVLGSLLIVVIAFQDYATAFFAGFSVVTNTFLGMLQEMNAKRKLDNLATLSEQEVDVIREGKREKISMRAVVLDDLIIIEPGNRLVVDGIIVKSDSLEIDESLLTGESDAIYKQPDDKAFSGSFCIAGTGIMKATHVGKDSNINQLSMIARQYKNVRTPTQVRIDILVEVTVLIMFLIIPLLFISDLAIQNVTLLQAVRNAVVFVTSLVPQGLVLVAILSLTIGALKISRHQTLVQKVNAVESLANATTLCFDKTGTLTKNELRVTDIIALNSAPKDEIYGQLWQYLKNSGHLNHTSQAVQDYVSDRLDAPQFVEKVREIPFSSGRKWGAILFDDETFVMGAPERLLPEHEGENTTIERVRELSNQGMRVLAFAWVEGEIDEDRIRQESLPIALVVLGDTIRDDIQETLQSFRDEDIELKVISGDSLETVRAIATQSGLNVTESHTETTLREMSDAEFDATVLKANVFARIEPDTKSRIVESLQKQDRYVAMTGDGVNDVPALKKANLAIVMNDGTQISKDVADIVLLNNAMSTLPLAFVEGREITQTIYGTMKIFLIKNGYTVLLFIFAALMALPFPITPVQISWATFGTINVPATLIAFGIIRPKYMSKFRRDVMDPIFTGSIIGSVALITLYAAVYLLYEDVMLARSSVTILLTLLSSYMVATVQGVDIYHPRTFLEHGRIVLILTILAILTIWSMYALPGLFEFKGLTFDDHLPIAIMITALQMLSMILLAHGDKYRYLLRRFWHLLRPDPEDGGREYSAES